MPTLDEQIKAAKRAAVPIISIETSDPAQTIVMCCQALNGGGGKGKTPTAFIEWDICRAAVGLNTQGKAVIRALPYSLHFAYLLLPAEDC
jgi:hypothetical protein